MDDKVKVTLDVLAAHGQAEADAAVISELLSVVDKAESVASTNAVEDVPCPEKRNAVHQSSQRYFRYSHNENSVFNAMICYFDKAMFKNMHGMKMSEYNDLFL